MKTIQIDAKLNQIEEVIKENSEGTLGHLQGRNIKKGLDKIYSEIEKLNDSEKKEKRAKSSQLQAKLKILDEKKILRENCEGYSVLIIPKKRL
ncbi:hypothetical protein R0L47_05235 [Pectobacterium polonicum]|uniref:hypothetical protein n=1 Tax=Pectobacterium polonicum TaxID=2485124 RepID=UPI0010F68EEF|nr:hypothetical protein [Pectobacterium polonicum]TKY81757.1 hypothetical protein EDI29_14170 [Pectobacterium polonicum]